MRRASALLLVLFVLAGCLPTGGGSATPVPLTPGPTAPANPSANLTPGPSLPSQTDTEWGRIWDALPPWFPIPDGAGPTETGEGPFTAELELSAGTTAIAAATFFRTEFQKAGFAEVNSDGPLEDGSFVISVPGGCQIEVRIGPLGGEVVASVLYGAGCPFE